MNKTATYYTHDNGGRPFKVEIEDLTVNISKIVDDSEIDYEQHHYEHIHTYCANGVFVGNSPKIGMTTYSGGHGVDFDGNSFLLAMGNNKYIYVGQSIFSFKARDTIIKYVSPVGNNDVPYPWATDIDGNIYLMIENVVILATEQNKNLMKEYDNPYDYYYDAHTMSSGPRTPLLTDMIKNDYDIVEWGLGTTKYGMTWCINPGKDYKRLIKFNEGPMYHIDSSGEKHIMTKKEYVRIIKDFGEKMGFEKISGIKKIHVRIW